MRSAERGCVGDALLLLLFLTKQLLIPGFFLSDPTNFHRYTTRALIH